MREFFGVTARTPEKTILGDGASFESGIKLYRATSHIKFLKSEGLNI